MCDTAVFDIFKRLMGDARAGNIVLEVALQCHANVTLIGEEIESKVSKLIFDFVLFSMSRRLH